MAVTWRQEEGFALVEAVVSLGIVAIVLGGTFQALGMARGALTAAEAHRAATLEARSLVAQLGSTISLVPGTSEGQSDKLRWRVDIDTVPSRDIGVPLRRAVVVVSDERSRPIVRLETLRLAQ